MKYRHHGNMNRHQMLRTHKRKMKERYAVNLFDYHDNIKLHEDECRAWAEENRNSYWYRKHPPRNGGYEYWSQSSRSGRKQALKRHSNKRIRQQYREMLANNDADEIPAYRGADYEKAYDYWWELW